MPPPRRGADPPRASAPEPSPLAPPRREVSAEATPLDTEERAIWLRFRAGQGHDCHRIFGAHPLPSGGFRFTVWAPAAREVWLEGEFSGWQGLPMLRPGVALTPSAQAGIARGGRALVAGRRGAAEDAAMDPRRGAFQLDVPGATVGQLYKFAVHGADGEWRRKADPFAFAAELRPGDASRICADPQHRFADADWMAARAERDWTVAPVAIYELHLGSWRRQADGSWLSYRALAPLLIEHVRRLGFSHVELLPPMEHPYDPSWGYQVTGYFAATARFGEPDDLRALVDALHNAGIGVLADWVPAHFPRDVHGLGRFDGTPLYEYADPRMGEHPDWGTLVFDYAKPEVRSFLLASAVFWLQSFHLDGLRVDAVASMLYRDYSRAEGAWVANALGGNWNLEAISLLQDLNATVQALVPGALMCAEESTTFPRVTVVRAPGDDPALGGLGFTFKWSMGWMHDTLRYLGRSPEHRSWHHHEMTFPSTWYHSERAILPLSHDEVVHGKGTLVRKMAGRWQDGSAQQRALHGWQFCFPGKKLLFMGAELVQDREWDVDRALPWDEVHAETAAGMATWLHALNEAYATLPAMHVGDADPEGMRWLEADDASRSVYAFLRCVPGRDPATAGPGDIVAVVASFSDLRHAGYPLRLPRPGQWTLRLCSDEERFGGRTPANRLPRTVTAMDSGGSFHATLDLPPFAIMLFDPPAEVPEPMLNDDARSPAGAARPALGSSPAPASEPNSASPPANTPTAARRP